MDFVAFATEWWAGWAFGLIGMALIGGYRHLRTKQKEQDEQQRQRQEELEKRQEAIECGMRAILRDRIISAYYHYHERGNITLHGLENVDAMFDSYTKLGGNGTVPGLVDAMHRMEVVDDD